VYKNPALYSGGAVAQLGARLDGIEEVVGSNPIGSTRICLSLGPVNREATGQRAGGLVEQGVEAFKQLRAVHWSPPLTSFRDLLLRAISR
jgi:hypothetical protein